MSTTIPRGLDESPDRSDSAGVARSEPVIWWVGCQGACVVGPFDWVVMRGCVAAVGGAARASSGVRDGGQPHMRGLATPRP